MKTTPLPGTRDAHGNLVPALTPWQPPAAPTGLAGGMLVVEPRRGGKR